MSLGYWWLRGQLEDLRVLELRQSFVEALEGLPAEDAETFMSLWRTRNPDGLVSIESKCVNRALQEEFNRAFVCEALDSLGRWLLGIGQPGWLADVERTRLEFLTADAPPNALLFAALGPARASLLPGRQGMFLLSAKQTAQVAAQLMDSRLDPSDDLAAGASWYGPVFEDLTAQQILEHYRATIVGAAGRLTGCFSLVMRQA